MCDYSLMSIPNRLANEGEELITHCFETGCIGLASASDLHPDSNSQAAQSRTFWSMLKGFLTLPEAKPVPAVCIPPGASLRLMDIPEKLQREFGIGPAEEVKFTQLTAAAHVYRDAVRFSNGREILLQGLRRGQRVRVLTLGPQDSGALPVPEELDGRLMRV
jgi:hypothetical protein